MTPPRWLTWLFLATLGYLIYSVGEQQRATTQPVIATPIPPSEATQTIAEFTDIEGWKRKLNPDYAATHNCTTPRTDPDTLPLQVIVQTQGSGAPAECGETITITLTLWGANGTPAYRTTIPLALGSRSLAGGLDAGLVGIKPGGIRTLVLPPPALLRNTKTKANAELMKALGGGKLKIVTIERVT